MIEGEIFFGNFLEKAVGTHGLRAAPKVAVLGSGHIEVFFGAGHADVVEAEKTFMHAAAKI